MSQFAAEVDAASVIGATVMAFGYANGCVVLVLNDGRQVQIGADTLVWYLVEEYTLQ